MLEGMVEMFFLVLLLAAADGGYDKRLEGSQLSVSQLYSECEPFGGGFVWDCGRVQDLNASLTLNGVFPPSLRLLIFHNFRTLPNINCNNFEQGEKLKLEFNSCLGFKVWAVEAEGDCVVEKVKAATSRRCGKEAAAEEWLGLKIRLGLGLGLGLGLPSLTAVLAFLAKILVANRRQASVQLEVNQEIPLVEDVSLLSHSAHSDQNSASISEPTNNTVVHLVDSEVMVSGLELVEMPMDEDLDEEPNNMYPLATSTPYVHRKSLPL